MYTAPVSNYSYNTAQLGSNIIIIGCHLNTIGQTPDNCEEDALRLMDGLNNASGRVEVCRFGCWGTVCDEGWDRDDAFVTCKQLGLETEEAIPTWGGYFGSVSSSRPILLSQTECGRDDDVLTNCSSFHLNNCTHSQDAGVFCYG